MNPGAPVPIVIDDEQRLVLAYLLREWAEKTWENRDEAPYAIVEFLGGHTHYFGDPNDEALSGHPLAERGLEAYAAFEVQDSSWIRSMERMNRVHHMHDPKSYEGLRHFIITFHDSTFECVAVAYRVTRWEGLHTDLIPEMARRLRL